MQLIFEGFEWDVGNQTKNLMKHNVGCQEAEETFKNFQLVYPDERHSSEKEKRYLLFGETRGKRQLLVAFTLRDKKIRIISVRPMSQKERTWYEQEKKKQIPG